MSQRAPKSLRELRRPPVYPKGNPELLALADPLRRTGMAWTQVAKRLKVSPCTLQTARKRHGYVDPMAGSTAKIRAIELEYGQPIREILEGFAEDGYTGFQTAQIIEFSWLGLQGLMERMGIHPNWPTGEDRNLMPFQMTDARREASARNIERARLKNIERMKARSAVNQVNAAKAHRLRMKRMRWADIAAELQMDISTLVRMRKRYAVPDPLNNGLQKQAQVHFKRRGAQL